MARFCTLCSSSGGNASYVGSASEGILIDAGINCKQLKLALNSVGIDPGVIKAIFVTHEHDDHIKGLRVFASSLGIPVYATGGTLAGLNNKGVLDGKFTCEKLMPGGVSLGNMHVDWFRTSHDAKESCGFRVEMKDRTLGIATDTGKMTDDILRALNGCDLVLLESNYDEDLLDFGPYPLPLKARIRSEIGHLSNPDCANTALELLDMGVRRIVLGHLSRENNTPDRAYACTHSALKRAGAEDGVDFQLSVAPVGCMEKIMIF